MEPLVVHFDGLCQPLNPHGIACFGFVVRHGEEVLRAEHGLAAEPFSEEATSNVAEYMGAIRAMEWVVEQGLHDRAVKVHGDSRLVIDHLSGLTPSRSPRLRPYAERARALARAFAKLEFAWIPRAENIDADALTEAAYVEQLERNEEFMRRARAFLCTPQEIAALQRRGIPTKPYLSRMEFMRHIRER